MGIIFLLPYQLVEIEKQKKIEIMICNKQFLAF